MSRPRRWAWLAACGLALSLRPSPAAALSVEPGVVELRAHAGTPAEGVFHVTNDTEEPVEVSVVLESLAAGYAPAAPGEWLQVSPTHLQLSPGSRQDVAYTVRVPTEARGELAAMVVFEHSVGAGTVQVRFGMALYAAVAGTEALELTLDPMQLIPGSPAFVRIPVTNRGNVHCRPEGTVTVTGADGMVQGRAVLPVQMPAHPGSTAHFSAALPATPLPPGDYELLADLTCQSVAVTPVPLRARQAGQLDADGRWSVPDAAAD